ncbi:hypothetical protein [Streptomyces phaeoluteigriseus]
MSPLHRGRQPRQHSDDLHTPMTLLVAMALALVFAAGAIAAGVPGGMRAQLSSTTPGHLRFSLLYAAGGLGYGAAALLTAGLVEATTPAVTIVVCTAVTTLIGLVAALGERAGKKKTGPIAERRTHPEHTTT